MEHQRGSHVERKNIRTFLFRLAFNKQVCQPQKKMKKPCVKNLRMHIVDFTPPSLSPISSLLVSPIFISMACDHTHSTDSAHMPSSHSFSSPPKTTTRSPGHLRFIISFLSARATLAFACAHPLNRYVAERHIVWPHPDRVEAYHCGRYTFRPVVLSDSSSELSASSSYESPSASAGSEDDEEADVAQRNGTDGQLHTVGRSSSTGWSGEALYASSTDWLTHRAEDLHVLAPRVGLRIGDHVIAVLPATSPRSGLTHDRPNTHSKLRGRNARGAVRGGAMHAVRTTALDDGVNSDDSDEVDDAEQTAVDRFESPGEVQLGSAVDIRHADDAQHLLRDSPFNTTVNTAHAFTQLDLVRVVYWEPRVGLHAGSPAAQQDEDIQDKAARMDSSLMWSLWWLARDAIHARVRHGDHHQAEIDSSNQESRSSGPSFPLLTTSLPVVLHARSTSLACLKQALSLATTAPTVGDAAQSRSLADLLTSLYVRLAASAEWIALVDYLSDHRQADAATVQSWERAGGLIAPSVAVLEALDAATTVTCSSSGSVERPGALSSAAPAGSSFAALPMESRLSRVVVLLPIREQAFLTRWREHQRRQSQGQTCQTDALPGPIPSPVLTTASSPSPASVSVGLRIDSHDDPAAPVMSAKRRHGGVQLSPARSLAPLARLTALREFDGSDSFLTDVNSLGELPRLEILLLANNRQLTSRGVVRLAQRTRSLRLVDLTGCSALGNEGAVAVAAIPTLEILSLSHTAVTAEGIPLLVSCASGRLRRLALDYCPRLAGTDRLVRALPRLVRFSALRSGKVEATTEAEAASVRHISVQGTQSLTNAQQWVFGFPHLESLDLSFTGIRASSFTPLTSSDHSDHDSAMRTNTHGTANVTDTHSNHDFAAREEAPTQPMGQAPLRAPLCAVTQYPRFLHTLSVEGCREIADLSPLGDLPALRVLRAGQTDINAAGLTGLSRCACLEEIDLRLCLNLQGVSPLERLPSLRVLNLFGCTALTDHGLAPIAASTTLRRLYLMSCHSLREVAFLGTMPSLRRLFLRDTSVSHTALAALADAHRYHSHALASPSRSLPSPGLVELDVAECVTVEAWPAACTRGLARLKHLSIDAGGLWSLPAEGLGQAVRVCTISGNQHLSALWPTIRATPSLRTLHATSLSLSTDALGLRAHTSDKPPLSESTRTSHRRQHALRTLDLTHCETLRDVDVLASLPHLAALNLSNTLLTDASLTAFTAVTKTAETERANTRTLLCGRCRHQCYPRGGRSFDSHGGPAGKSKKTRRAARAVCAHRPLRALSLQQCRGIFSTDALTASLCPHLHTLVLSESNVNDEGLVSLAWCAHLIVLRLDGCKGVSQLTPLAHLPRLEELHANGTNITTAGLAGLVFGLDASAVHKASTRLGLRESDLSHPRTTQAQQAMCGNTHTHKNGMEAEREATEDVCISTHASRRRHTSNLQFLSVCGCPMIFAGITPLAFLPRLRVLNISNCRNLTSAHFSALKAARDRCAGDMIPLFPSLEVLDVSRCVLLEGSLDGLETLPKLRDVYTAGTPLGELSMPVARRLLLADGAL